MKTLPALEQLIACFSKLPGVGRRSAERMALKLVSDTSGLLQNMTAALEATGRSIIRCSTCGALTERERDPCRFCIDPMRDTAVLCVVEDPADVMRIEKAGGYRGRYHVLHGKLSPMQGIGPEQLCLEALTKRLQREPIREIILALNTDVESDATAALIRERLNGCRARITRPAMGIPAGSGIAYSDAVTLARAFSARQTFS